VLPIPEPQNPHSTVLDVRNATPPPRFEEKAPAGAPNVLIVPIDDMGFGQSGAFGGPIAMPTMDRLANNGLRYNEFHTTALCSPTRMALLTGRNHHMGNMGSVTKTAAAFPGNTGQRPDSVAPMATMLRYNGYTTAAEPVPAGKATIRYEFAYDGGSLAKGASARSSSTGRKRRKAGSNIRNPLSFRPMKEPMSVKTARLRS
jgi:hypothetical protein